MASKFEGAHEMFIKSHFDRRKGERKGRLVRGERHGETLFLKNVWWPLYKNFDYLHPEYEVPDWRGRPYFGDFAYLCGQMKLIIEVKGYGSHVQDQDRTGYCNELNRELFMQTLGYRIASFAYDDVKSRPELCRNLLDSLLKRYQSSEKPIDRRQLAEKEVIRLAMETLKPITTKQVALHLQINYRTALKIIRSLCEMNWLRPIVSGDGKRIRCYELVPGRREEHW